MDETLDLRGLKCPLPAFFARRALQRSAPGAMVIVLTDDPLAPLDIPHMCRQEGYEVVALTRQDQCAEMRLRRPA